LADLDLVDVLRGDTGRGLWIGRIAGVARSLPATDGDQQGADEHYRSIQFRGEWRLRRTPFGSRRGVRSIGIGGLLRNRLGVQNGNRRRKFKTAIRLSPIHL